MDPLLLDIPDRLDTPRLRLRVPRAGDGPLTAAGVVASLAELKRWMPWATDGYGDVDGETWCRRAFHEFYSRKQLQFLILSAATGEHLGNAGAFRFNWDVRTCEIGYWLRTDRTGNGFMAEAVEALCAMLTGVLAMRRIEIRCDAQNGASGRVALRCGFELDGRLRCDSVDPLGLSRDTLVFSRITPT